MLYFPTKGPGAMVRWNANSHWTFMPLDFSSGPTWKSTVYITWQRIVRELQNKIQPECDKITEHKLWCVQTAVTGHIIKCHKFGGPKILELLHY